MPKRASAAVAPAPAARFVRAASRARTRGERRTVTPALRNERTANTVTPVGRFIKHLRVPWIVPWGLFAGSQQQGRRYMARLLCVKRKENQANSGSRDSPQNQCETGYISNPITTATNRKARNAQIASRSRSLRRFRLRNANARDTTNAKRHMVWKCVRIIASPVPPRISVFLSQCDLYGIEQDQHVEHTGGCQ